MKIMMKSRDNEVTWLLKELCFREMPLRLSSKPFVSLCVDVDKFILRPSEKGYFDDILLPKQHAIWMTYSHLNMASIDVHKRKLILMEGYLLG